MAAVGSEMKAQFILKQSAAVGKMGDSLLTGKSTSCELKRSELLDDHVLLNETDDPHHLGQIATSQMLLKQILRIKLETVNGGMIEV